MSHPVESGTRRSTRLREKSQVKGQAEPRAESRVECLKLVLEDIIGDPFALLQAVLDCGYDCLRVFIDAGVDLNVPCTGRTVLMVAAIRGWLQGVNALLEAGANVNYVSSYGPVPRTALFEAAGRSVKALLRHGSFVNNAFTYNFEGPLEGPSGQVQQGGNKHRLLLAAGERKIEPIPGFNLSASPNLKSLLKTNQRPLAEPGPPGESLHAGSQAATAWCGEGVSSVWHVTGGGRHFHGGRRFHGGGRGRHFHGG